MRSLVRWALLFLAGAVAGTALDHLHVSFGVLDYPGPHWFAQPLWVPPLFGGATLLFVAGYRPFRSPGEQGTPLRALSFVLLFALAYLCSAVFHAHPRALLLGLVAAYLPFLGPFTWDSNLLRRVAYSLSIALGGSLFEVNLVRQGAFRYLAHGRLPVPIWLPGLYLFAALAAAQLDLACFPRRDSSVPEATIAK